MSLLHLLPHERTLRVIAILAVLLGAALVGMRRLYVKQRRGMPPKKVKATFQAKVEAAYAACRWQVIAIMHTHNCT